MRQEFEAVIQKVEGINGAYVEPPFDVEKVFGAKRVKVLATFDGVPYRGSLVRMGGCYMIGMTQEIRKIIGKEPGDIIRVTVERDEEERNIQAPSDFMEVLVENNTALSTYERLSYSKKREYVLWITDAKKEETRKARIEKAIERLNEGKGLK